MRYDENLQQFPHLLKPVHIFRLGFTIIITVHQFSLTRDGALNFKHINSFNGTAKSRNIMTDKYSVES